jgi:hypothetical protein
MPVPPNPVNFIAQLDYRATEKGPRVPKREAETIM